MSKKNNRKLRHQAHQYALRKEKEEREKQQKKIERKKQNEETLNIMKKLEIDSNRKPRLYQSWVQLCQKKDKTERRPIEKKHRCAWDKDKGCRIQKKGQGNFGSGGDDA
eukprot:jgi/Picre1/30614/NNA_005975.t1